MSTKKVKKKIVPDGQNITIPSESRPDKTHYIYTGDNVNSPLCSCEDWRYGDRVLNVLYTCKHIDKEVFGIERSKS